MNNFHHKHQHKPYALCICGPTASGKTALSLQIAKHIPAEIINADIGQFYTPLSVGTAKPNWQNMPTPHHLFDIIDEPKDINVNLYRKLVIDKVTSVWDKNKLPIVVGGSLFYIKTLFYPLIELPKTACYARMGHKKSSWDELNKIDPDRAKAIHPNDSYRIQRALAIWQETGKKPSTYEPKLDPPFNTRIIFLNWPREILFERINQRAKDMLKDGWIEEVKRLIDWKDFLQKKRLIGYPEIIAWLDRGGRGDEISDLEASIQKNTRHYAKRQVTFWKKFRNILGAIPVDEVAPNKEGRCEAIIKNVKNDLGAL
jgi:tRNA dimethylallyltransferase